MANIEDITTEDIGKTINIGQKVYDNQGKRLGTVDLVDQETGYVLVEESPFAEKDLYIPFSRITSIDARELYLSLSREELLRDYADPPPRSTLVTKEGKKELATTIEPSGYDGDPIVVERARIDTLRKQIATGDRVESSDAVEVGTVKQYDPVTGWMLIAKGPPPHKTNLMVPVTVVRDVDRDAQVISLVTSRADLERMQPREPADVVFVKGEPKDGS